MLGAGSAQDLAARQFDRFVLDRGPGCRPAGGRRRTRSDRYRRWSSERPTRCSGSAQPCRTATAAPDEAETGPGSSTDTVFRAIRRRWRLRRRGPALIDEAGKPDAYVRMLFPRASEPGGHKRPVAGLHNGRRMALRERRGLVDKLVPQNTLATGIGRRRIPQSGDREDTANREQSDTHPISPPLGTTRQAETVCHRSARVCSRLPDECESRRRHCQASQQGRKSLRIGRGCKITVECEIVAWRLKVVALKTHWHQTVFKANRVKNEILWFCELDATGLSRGGSRFQLHEAIPRVTFPPRFARGGFAAAGETGWEGVKGCVRGVCSEKRKHPSGKPRAFVRRQSEYRQLERPFGARRITGSNRSRRRVRQPVSASWRRRSRSRAFRPPVRGWRPAPANPGGSSRCVIRDCH